MEVTGQWADSLAALERLFHLKLLAWGALSALLGTTLLLVVRRSPNPLPLLDAFAITLLAAGAVESATALLQRQSVSLRNLASATALDRSLWLTAGITLGWALAALVIAVVAWRSRDFARRATTLGACLAIVLHGSAIALLCVQLGRVVVR